MAFQPTDSLSEAQRESALRRVIADGLASQTFVTLTGGAFLVGFALSLGASNTVIGLLAAIPPLAQLLQLPAIPLVERLRMRRAISVYASTFSRATWVGIAALPFIAPPDWVVPLLILGLFIQSAFSAFSMCAWNSWMRDLVPRDRLGSFFARRLSATLAFTAMVSLAAAAFIDRYPGWTGADPIEGYTVLFLVGASAGFLGVTILSTIPEPRMAPPTIHEPVTHALRRPFRDPNFRHLIRFLAAWNFAINLAAPFFTVYMLVRLELGLSTVIALIVLSQVMNVMALRVWGPLSDRYSNKSVLAVAGPLVMIAVLGWTFTTLPDAHAMTMPILVVIHVVKGISMAGVTLASGNIGMKLAPPGQATAYLAAGSFANSIAAGTAPLLGGLMADFFASRQLALAVEGVGPSGSFVLRALSLEHWDFLFVMAFVIGLYALHRLSLVEEEGEIDDDEFMAELLGEVRREMRNLSPIGGLRQMVQFPYFLLRLGVMRR